jgi:hypothetical protein
MIAFADCNRMSMLKAFMTALMTDTTAWLVSLVIPIFERLEEITMIIKVSTKLGKYNRQTYESPLLIKFSSIFQATAIRCWFMHLTLGMVRYDYSYIESAALRIGDDILEVSSFGEYILNGVDSATRPNTMSGFVVSHEQPDAKQHSFVVDLTDGNVVKLSAFKDIVSIKIGTKKGPYGPRFIHWFANSSGMMGSFVDGQWLAQNGQTSLTDPMAFGQEWQVRDVDPQLFGTLRAPQFPEKCKFPVANEETSRRRLRDCGRVPSTEPRRRKPASSGARKQKSFALPMSLLSKILTQPKQ